MRAVPAVSIKGTLGPGPVGCGEPGTGAGRRVFVWPGEYIATGAKQVRAYPHWDCRSRLRRWVMIAK
ncbi:hypothetical protein Mkiyose1665_57750 [Mycobacterium kiyosense]|nr:hypothetical protein MKCMC460_61760 [Mycobacterium sp. 20KCMC460]GLB93009.1 hypothetical protein SRL2020130_58260 [Mycobacterium kiyosense]GLB99288.1 hypothetical protein SRL2020226_60640 [Mycobacterium kiyosense]GLC04150.1 hypothetical protein SRL2020400_47410 [Mycobacterium kiyosense]GLC11012.1 hypothetical protein SRL2020411_56580 [Mycobacterium kiyosense]